MLPAQLSKRLESISKVSKDGKRVNGLYRLLGYPQLWMEAYAKIYRNKGAITQGVDNLTLDGFSDERVLNHIQLIKNGSYKPNPVRRALIPKRNGQKRPLGIPSGNDKLTQEVFRMILERIYEPTFHRDSHGFMKKRSCHSALEGIKNTWTGVKWIVSIDIKGFFDNMNHEKMIQILERRIDDTKFIGMIQDMLKAGYLEDWKYHNTYSGVPQSGIISPILSNIYLNELDTFVSKLKEDFERGKKRKQNLSYKWYSNRIHALYKKVDQLKSDGLNAEADEMIRMIKGLNEERSKLPASDPFDNGYRRLRYCRYADDFLLGVIGGKSDAAMLKGEIESFLSQKLLLEVSTEKTVIAKATDGVEYLGYGVRTASYRRRKTIGRRGSRTIPRRAGSERLQFYIPRHKKADFVRKHGYGIYDGLKFKHRSNLIFREDMEIISRYNSELRGFANYYKLVGDFKTELNTLQYIWISSMIKTLATKHKSTVRKTFKWLKGPDRYKLKFTVQGNTRYLNVFNLKDIKVNEESTNPDKVESTIMFARARTSVLDRLEASKCEYCHKEGGYFEVHHVKGMKDLSMKKPWEEAMIALRRKTIVLCIDCHQELHKGTLPDYRHLRKR